MGHIPWLMDIIFNIQLNKAMTNQGKLIPSTLLGGNFAQFFCLKSTFAGQDQQIRQRQWDTWCLYNNFMENDMLLGLKASNSLWQKQ